MDHPTPAARARLAARWREDAQVFRRYGSTARARMLERLADELEQTADEDAHAVADLATAARLTGFTRGHLRRLYRERRLIPVGMEDGEPVFRVVDLPRKPGSPERAAHAGSDRRAIAEDVVRGPEGAR